MNLKSIFFFIFAENPEIAELGAIQLLPELFSQPPSKVRHVRNVGLKTGRISRQDVVAGFVRFVEEAAVNDEKLHYLTECSENGAVPSPIIFAVGTDLRIERYLVFIAGETQYVFNHFRNAVLCLFSAYWALHAPCARTQRVHLLHFTKGRF